MKLSERARPDIRVRRDVQQRLDWKKPPRVTCRGVGLGLVEEVRGPPARGSVEDQ
jgi:hypothetical protein